MLTMKIIASENKTSIYKCYSIASAANNALNKS